MRTHRLGAGAAVRPTQRRSHGGDVKVQPGKRATSSTGIQAAHSHQSTLAATWQPVAG